MTRLSLLAVSWALSQNSVEGQETVEVEIAKDIKVSVMRTMIADLRDKKDASKTVKAKEDTPKQGLGALFGKKK